MKSNQFGSVIITSLGSLKLKDVYVPLCPFTQTAGVFACCSTYTKKIVNEDIDTAKRLKQYLNQFVGKNINEIDVDKYIDFYYSRKWKDIFPIIPSILCISDKKVPRIKVLDIKVCKLDLKDLTV